MNINIKDEDYRIPTAQRVFTYYPQELKDLLSKIDIKTYRGEFVFSDTKLPNQIGVISATINDSFVKVVRDSEKSNYAKLDVKNVGREVKFRIKIYNGLDTLFSDGDYAEDRIISIADFLNGDYMPEDEYCELAKLIKLFEQAKQQVLFEISERQRIETKRNMTPEERDAANIRKAHEFPGVDDEFIEWCKKHLVRITLWAREDLVDVLKNKFPESQYLQNNEMTPWSDDSYSWGAKVFFDSIVDCPNPEVVNKFADKDSSVSSIALAEELYEHGFDFGKQPRYWKKVS